ncbi:MAG: hypothetical protein ACXVAY_17525 [Mucilaginibacter sp.]
MKIVAVFLCCCVLFFSSFSGMVKPVRQSVTKMSCHQMRGKMNCHQQQKPTDGKGCEPGCTLLFLCPLLGFIVPEPLSLSARYATILNPVTLYKIGAPSWYYPSNWKPPKTC